MQRFLERGTKGRSHRWRNLLSCDRGISPAWVIRAGAPKRLRLEPCENLWLQVANRGLLFAAHLYELRTFPFGAPYLKGIWLYAEKSGCFFVCK